MQIASVILYAVLCVMVQRILIFEGESLFANSLRHLLAIAVSFGCLTLVIASTRDLRRWGVPAGVGVFLAVVIEGCFLAEHVSLTRQQCWLWMSLHASLQCGIRSYLGWSDKWTTRFLRFTISHWIQMVAATAWVIQLTRSGTPFSWCLGPASSVLAIASLMSMGAWLVHQNALNRWSHWIMASYAMTSVVGVLMLCLRWNSNFDFPFQAFIWISSVGCMLAAAWVVILGGISLGLARDPIGP